MDSRLGRRGGVLPLALLIIGAAASPAANIPVAEPTLLGRVIEAWPSFALTAAYELSQPALAEVATPGESAPVPPDAGTGPRAEDAGTDGGRRVLLRQAWQWALANRRPDGSLPVRAQIAEKFDRSDRWGRLVTGLGRAGQLPPRPRA